MATWHSRNLGDPMLAAAAIDAIEAAFCARFPARPPSGATVFVRHESDGRLHCDLVAYFPPAAADVARAVGAVECNRPALPGLGRLIGDG